MREIHRVITSMDAPNDLNASDGFSDFKSDRIPIKRKSKRVTAIFTVLSKFLSFAWNVSCVYLYVCIQFYLEFGTSFPLSRYYFDQTLYLGLFSFFFEIKIISLIIYSTHKNTWWLSIYFLQMIVDGSI